MKNFPIKAFFAAALGTMVEYYDYALFALFLPIIAPLFFPAATAYQSLIKGYVVLLIAMLVRPFGGVLFGYIGDRYGRRKALLGSMYGIAVATFLIGLTPSYAVIGVWATILVTLLKAVQIFCFGGEYNGAGIYVVEHAQNKREALTGALLSATTLFGSVFASLIGVVVTSHHVPDWTWRLAFILGGCVGLWGIQYRKNLQESPNFKTSDLSKEKLIHLLKRYPRKFLAGTFIGGLATVPFCTVVVFINPVLMSKGYLSAHHLMILQTGLILLAVIGVTLSGAIADRHTPVKVMKIGSGLIVLLIYPLLLLVDYGSMSAILSAQVAIILISETFLGPTNAYLKNAFPMKYRYRGASISFCIGMSLLGGFTPIIENSLYQWGGSFSAVAIWPALVALGAFLSIKKQLPA